MTLPTRTGALGLAVALTATGLSLLSSPATAVGVDPAPSTSATTWLKSQLTGNLLLTTAAPVPDSLEAALGLQVAGDAATAAAIRDAVAPTIGAYVAPTTDPEPDPVARVAWYAQQLGANANTYGGQPLLDDLASFIGTDGRLVDTLGAAKVSPDPTPTAATTAGQAFATAALVAGGASYAADAAAATTYTASLQCAGATGGFFNDSLPATGATVLCDPTKPSVAATALYVIAMTPSPGAAANVKAAADWLVKAQQSNGRWVADGGQGAGDALTTALASYAVQLAGRPAAAQGAVWLRSLQLANAGTCAAFPATDLGAVAPDGAAYAGVAGRLDDFRRATARSLLVLKSAPGGPAITDNLLTVPRFTKPGRKVTAAVRSAPRNLICASAPGLAATRLAVAYDGTASFDFIAAATGTTAATITDPTGQVDTASVTTLAKKKLRLQFKSKRVRKGKVAVVKVSGLAPGERVRVQLRGRERNAGIANSAGKVKLRFVANANRGYAKVRVVGQYNNRNRTKNLIIVR